MVELIVVMVFIGILGAIGTARFFSRAEYDSPAFADQAAAALRFAQKVAIAQNRPVFVRFDAQSISLCFQSGAACPAASRVLAPFSVTTDSTYCVSSAWYCLRRPSTVSFTLSLPIPTGGARYVSFDGLGRPFDDNTPAQATGLTFTVSGSNNVSQVRVAAETGYVY